MLIIHVHIRVKPDTVEAFRAATIENARNSVQEPGIARFDFIQDQADPTRFVLIEVYRAPEARTQHRTTAHYNTWREAVEQMMAEPRTSAEFRNIFPGDDGW